MNLGEELRRLRRYRQFTLSTVSEQTGLSISFLSDVERGRTKPSLDTLQKLADCYGVAMNDILKNVDSEQEDTKPVYPPGFEEFIASVGSDLEPEIEDLLLRMEHRSKRKVQTKEDWTQLYYTLKTILGR